MTRYPLIAAALAGAAALAPALPAAANHGPYCVSSPDQVLWCSPDIEDYDPTAICFATTDEWCSPTATQVVHGNADLTDLPGAFCAYTHDGGWCSPSLEDEVEVTEFCVYPYDGGWCVPWVKVGS